MKNLREIVKLQLVGRDGTHQVWVYPSGKLRVVTQGGDGELIGSSYTEDVGLAVRNAAWRYKVGPKVASFAPQKPLIRKGRKVRA